MRRPLTLNMQYRAFLYNNFEEHQDTLDMIEKNTNINDKILVWGSESSLYFLSKRQSPSKYFYQYALFTPGYTNNDKFSELLSEISVNKPKIIIDASRSTIDKEIGENQIVPPIKNVEDWVLYNYYNKYPSFNKVYEFFKDNYKFMQPTYNGMWSVYVLDK